MMMVSRPTVFPVRYVSIEEELKRNPELKMSDLLTLKKWIDKQPHLPNIEILYIIMFLHSNYYNIEAAKRTMENFFTVRTHCPEVFSNRDPIGWRGLRKTFNVTACIPLEYKTKEGYIMALTKFLDPNPNQFDFNESLKYLLLSCEIQHIVTGTSKGFVVVCDAANLSLGHLARINLTMAKKIAFYIQEAIPVRLKALHIINTMPIVTALINMVKPFIKAELIKLLHFHTNLDTVKEFFPLEALPNEYVGGKAGPIEKLVADHLKLLEEFRGWLAYDEFIGRVDESLRVNKSEVKETLFGVDGSFKKLDVD